MREEFDIVDGVLKKYYGDKEAVCIPEGVTKIGESVFDSCTSLSSVTIPECVTQIGDSAFFYCTNLRSVHICNLESWYQIKFATWTSNPLCNGADLYIGGKQITEVIIPANIKVIPDYVFFGGRSLSSIIIPEGVTKIGESAFANCISLSNITIPKSVTKIAADAFSACRNLSSITIFANITKIVAWTFRRCSSLKSIIIPEGVTEINDWAFDECNHLRNITIPQSVTKISEYAFYGCDSLSSITIPEQVTEITWWDVFEQYESLVVYCSPELFEKLPVSVQMHTAIHWLQYPQNFSEKQTMVMEDFVKKYKNRMVKRFIENKEAGLLQKILEKVVVHKKTLMRYIDFANTGNRVEVMAVLLEFQWRSNQ